MAVGPVNQKRHFRKEEIFMSGTIILGIGIGLVVLSVIVFVVSIIYRKTAGKRIREELKKEYE